MQFFNILVDAISRKDKYECNTLIIALQLAHAYKVDYTIPFLCRDWDNNVNESLYMHVYKHDIEVLKTLILLSKGKEFIIDLFYEFINLKDLSMVKFFVEEVGVSLLQPSILFKHKYKYPIYAAGRSLDIFKYLLPLTIAEFESLSEDEKLSGHGNTDLFNNIDKFIKKSLNNISNKIAEGHSTNTQYLETLEEERELLKCYSNIESVFKNYTFNNLVTHFTVGYNIDKAFSITLLGSFLAAIAIKPNETHINSKSLKYYLQMIKFVYKLIDEDQHKNKLKLLFMNSIVTEYLAVLSFYRLSKEPLYKSSDEFLDNNGEYKSSIKFLIKKDLAPALSLMKGSVKGKVIDVPEVINSGKNDVSQNNEANINLDSVGLEVINKLYILLGNLEKFSEFARVLAALASEGNSGALTYIQKGLGNIKPDLQLIVLDQVIQLYNGMLPNKNHIDSSMALSYQIRQLLIYKDDNNNLYKDKQSELVSNLHAIVQDPEAQFCDYQQAWITLMNYYLDLENEDVISHLIADAFVHFPGNSVRMLLHFIDKNFLSAKELKSINTFSDFLSLIERMDNGNTIVSKYINNISTGITSGIIKSKFFSLDDQDSFEKLKKISGNSIVLAYSIAKELYLDLLGKPNYSLLTNINAYNNYTDLIGLEAMKGCKKSLKKLEEIFLFAKNLNNDYLPIKQKIAEYEDLFKQSKIEKSVVKEDLWVVLGNKKSLIRDAEIKESLRTLKFNLLNWIVKSTNERVELNNNSKKSIKIPFFTSHKDKELYGNIVRGKSFAHQLINNITKIVNNDFPCQISLDLPHGSKSNVDINCAEDFMMVIEQFLSTLPKNNSSNTLLNSLREMLVEIFDKLHVSVMYTNEMKQEMSLN